VRWEKTWSCYPDGEVACGVCDSCHLPRAAFKELGLQDPLPYAPKPNTDDKNFLKDFSAQKFNQLIISFNESLFQIAYNSYAIFNCH